MTRDIMQDCIHTHSSQWLTPYTEGATCHEELLFSKVRGPLGRQFPYRSNPPILALKHAKPGDMTKLSQPRPHLPRIKFPSSSIIFPTHPTNHLFSSLTLCPILKSLTRLSADQSSSSSSSSACLISLHPTSTISLVSFSVPQLTRVGQNAR